MAQASVKILPDRSIGTINPNIYGHFAEHLGRCIDEGIWVGPYSPIDNHGGIRTDVAEALRKLEIPVLRWPGGCFADAYDWRDGIGSSDQRPIRRNIWWGREEDNQFGTDEFLRLCEITGAQPYICGNVGSGSPREMMDWVEYCNYDGNTDLARLRAENGHPDPYEVDLWGVGNENWGCGGHMEPEEYARHYRRFETYLQPRDTELTLIACGHDHCWNHAFLNTLGSADSIDMLSIHHYYKAGPGTGFSDDEYYQLMAEAISLEPRIIRDTHLIRFFEGDNPGRVGLAIDEWGCWHPEATRPRLYQPSTHRDALSAAVVFDVFNRHADSVAMANIAQTVNVLHAIIQTDEEKMWLTPTYHIFDLYRPHMNNKALEAMTDCEAVATDAGDEVPCVSASASRDGDRLFVTITNLHLSEAAEVTVSLSECDLAFAEGQILSADAPDAVNGPDAPDRVTLAEYCCDAENGSLSCGIPAASSVGIWADITQ
ncbi:MAG: alpha-L-arabinofuranosidase C-terminal domain-containing protein [Armatimonadota bacterium]